MEKQIYTVGMRVEKFCAECGEDRGHVVALLNGRGQISRVSCPKCGTHSTFKTGMGTSAPRRAPKSGLPYDRTRRYRTGQVMMHTSFGEGEVTAVIEPHKIDVLFSDRMRRLVHACTEG